MPCDRNFPTDRQELGSYGVFGARHPLQIYRSYRYTQSVFRELSRANLLYQLGIEVQNIRTVWGLRRVGLDSMERRSLLPRSRWLGIYWSWVEEGRWIEGKSASARTAHCLERELAITTPLWNNGSC